MPTDIKTMRRDIWYSNVFYPLFCFGRSSCFESLLGMNLSNKIRYLLKPEDVCFITNGVICLPLKW